MKKHFSQLFLSTVLVVALFCLSKSSIAQVGNPGDDVDTPIDGGLSILIAAGVGYGIKKVRDERKKKSNKLS